MACQTLDNTHNQGGRGEISSPLAGLCSVLLLQPEEHQSHWQPRRNSFDRDLIFSCFGLFISLHFSLMSTAASAEDQTVQCGFICSFLLPSISSMKIFGYVDVQWPSVFTVLGGFRGEQGWLKPCLPNSSCTQSFSQYFKLIC